MRHLASSRGLSLAALCLLSLFLCSCSQNAEQERLRAELEAAKQEADAAKARAEAAAAEATRARAEAEARAARGETPASTPADPKGGTTEGGPAPKGNGQPEGKPTPEPAVFFNGKDLTGWRGLDKYWKVVDGALVGTPPAVGQRHTFLCSEYAYGDFELSFKVQRKGGIGNTGVQLRSWYRNPVQCSLFGLQVEIAESSFAFPPGSVLHEPTGRPSFKADAVAKAEWKNEGFNDMHIKCVGKHVTVKINGKTVTDADYPAMPKEGIIGFQLHGGYGPIRPPEQVTFKDIQFTALTPRKPLGAIRIARPDYSRAQQETAAAILLLGFGYLAAQEFGQRDTAWDSLRRDVQAEFASAILQSLPANRQKSADAKVQALFLLALSGSIDIGTLTQEAAKEYLLQELRKIDKDLADAARLADLLYTLYQASQQNRGGK